MIIFELNKEDSEYTDRISQLSEMSIVVEDPKSFCSDLNTVIQIGGRAGNCTVCQAGNTSGEEYGLSA